MGNQVVSELMCGEPEEEGAFVGDAIEDDAGILHTAGGEAGDADGVGPGVGIPVFGEALDGVFGVFGGAVPGVGADGLSGG